MFERFEKFNQYLKFVPVVAVVFAVACVVRFFMVTSDNQSMLDRQVAELHEIESRMDDLSKTMTETRRTVMSEARGIDFTRVDIDTENVRKFLETVCTWNDTDTYMKARESVSNRYGIDLDGEQFFTDFMAPMEISVSPTSGIEIDPIVTQNLNMKLGDVQTYVTEATDDAYGYLVEFDMISTNLGRDASTSAIMLVSIKKDGTFFNVSAQLV